MKKQKPKKMKGVTEVEVCALDDMIDGVLLQRVGDQSAFIVGVQHTVVVVVLVADCDAHLRG